jgi:hypothetical protein
MMKQQKRLKSRGAGYPLIEGEYFVCKADLDHQKRGSALTYAKRHSLFAIVGVAGADDDEPTSHPN